MIQEGVTQLLMDDEKEITSTVWQNSRVWGMRRTTFRRDKESTLLAVIYDTFFVFFTIA
jgi:hypothetical protein